MRIRFSINNLKFKTLIYIYNATDNVFNSLDEYLDGLSANATDSYFVVFLVNISDLFVAVKKKTALRARFAKGQNGESLLDQLVMTDDELDFFTDTIKQGAPGVFRKLSAWAKLIDQAYKHDVTFGDDAVSKYIIYSISMDLNWDINMLQGVDNSIWNALVSYAVKTWYYLNRYAEDYEAEEGQYQVEISNIRSQLMQTKAPIRRPVDILTDSSRSITLTIIPTTTAVPSPTVTFYQFITGALVGEVIKSVAHNKNWASYTIVVKDPDGQVVGVENVEPTPGNEANSVDILVSVDIAEPGLTIEITKT